jgi:beta-glucosidase/6-phospho-beta-glucosidase/beta-galactosidase
MSAQTPFRSFFMAGFECSTHCRADGHRLDLVASTRHDEHAESDFRQIGGLGLRCARDGVRWHLIERSPGHYDWTSFLHMLRAARQADMQVMWDLCHYGWPDDLDIWSAAFVDRFARFCSAAARVAVEESGGVPQIFCPVNEISYWAWAGGEVARLNPLAEGRGAELKRQLVRASIEGMQAIHAVDRRARFIFAEPAIHVVSGSTSPDDQRAAENYRLAQFEAYDMLAGLRAPELGGKPEFLDIVGVNFYPDNQWYLGGSTIPLGHHAYRPLRLILEEFHRRYGRPILITETGAENSAKASWLHYVCGETQRAIASGTPVLGICLYPILDYPGWNDGRPCNVGLLTEVGDDGRRQVCPDLLPELRVQQKLLEPWSEPPGAEPDPRFAEIEK